jgi:hypothetical protein
LDGSRRTPANANERKIAKFAVLADQSQRFKAVALALSFWRQGKKRRNLFASLNAGAVVIVSAFAVVVRSPMLGSFAQKGIRSTA